MVGRSYIKEFSHFCRVVLERKTPDLREDGRRTLEVTLAIQKSGETGQPIVL